VTGQQARVVALRAADGRPASVGLRPDSTSILIGEQDVLAYDLAGRPYTLVRGRTTHRRSLDGRLLRLGREPRFESVEEAARLLEAARADVDLVRAAAQDAGEAEVAERLRAVVARDTLGLAADAARFRALYKPIGILPPDQYLAVVLQATEGCSWNECSFCGLYRDTPFRLTTAEEFDRHVAAVVEFMGPSLRLRRSAFLGDANALAAGPERVLAWLRSARRHLPELPVHAFLDAWTGQRKDAAFFAECRGLGLARVHVGLETGDPELLAWLDKAGSPDDAVALVGALHEAQVAAGVIVLLGAGGSRFGQQHVAGTVEVLRRMALGLGDLLYFSEFVLDERLPYARKADAPDLLPLDAAGCQAQREQILDRLGLDPTRRPRIAPYDIRRFVY
jgi:hypothetical protein